MPWYAAPSYLKLLKRDQKAILNRSANQFSNPCQLTIDEKSCSIQESNGVQADNFNHDATNGKTITISNYNNKLKCKFKVTSQPMQQITHSEKLIETNGVELGRSASLQRSTLITALWYGYNGRLYQIQIQRKLSHSKY